MLKNLFGIFSLLILVVALKGQTTQYPNFDYQPLSFIDSSSNCFQVANKNILRPFFFKLQNSQKKKIQIIHFQDNHSQHSTFQQNFKSKFQSVATNSGTGIIFPYSISRIAEIIPYRGYKSFHYGKWIYAKSVEPYPLISTGLNLISAKTFDAKAQFKLYFHKDFVKPTFKRIRIFCKRVPQSFDFQIKTKKDSVKVDVYSNAKDSMLSEIIIDLKSIDNTLSFELIQKNESQESFELYGLSLENPDDHGFVYHHIGCVSLSYQNLNKNSIFEKELITFKPDCIILELGKFDFFSKVYDPYMIRRKINRIIDQFKSLPSKPLIVLVSPQDQLKGKFSNTDFAKFSLLLSDIAKNEKVAFLDWYRISGGHLSMAQWQNFGFATSQGNELTYEGNFLKSGLFIDAFRQTSLKIQQRKDSLGSTMIPILDSGYLLRIDTSKKVDTAIQIDVLQTKKNTINQISQHPNWVNHIVKHGETVWSIAENYDVKAGDIKKWNNLRSYSLKKGKKLRVYTSIPNGKVVDEVDFTNAKGVPAQQKNTNKKYYKIKRGDTLYSISRRFNVTVNEIKSFNGMQSNDLTIGKKLRVK